MTQELCCTDDIAVHELHLFHDRDPQPAYVVREDLDKSNKHHFASLTSIDKYQLRCQIVSSIYDVPWQL